MGDELSGNEQPARNDETPDDTAPTEGRTPPAEVRAPSSGPWKVGVAVAAVLGLIVGLLTGLAVSGDSDDGGSDDDAAEDDSDGHAHSAGTDDEESGLAQLLEDHHYHEPTDETIDGKTRALLTAQLAPLDDLTKELPTIADAEAADWRRAGPFIPGLGTHYISRDQAPTFTIRDSLDGDEDTGTEVRALLIYDGLEEDSALAGFMLMAMGEEPGDFAGPQDVWHQHTNVCVVSHEGGDIDLPFVGDMESTTEERCEDVGGRLTEVTSHMVHVWSIPTYGSELGLFSEVNPRITCPDGTYHRVPYDDLEPPYTTTCPEE